MIQRIVFGLCVFVVSIVVVEAVSAKAVARLAHNQNTSDDNGEMLVAATIRAADHQATMGTWIGKTALKDGGGVMTDWSYLDGAQYLPTTNEVKKLRAE